MDKKKMIREVKDYALMILAAIILAFLMNRFIYANAEVPTGSMEPVVMPNDRLIVNRLSYLFSEPKRGDIVMFKFPDDESEDYLKRIIGLPGETLVIKNGLVFINNSEKPLDEPYLKDEPNGDFGPYYIPEGSYFMMGDNRDTSSDARIWENKFVKKEKIVGKAFFRYYPNISLLHSATYE